MQTWLQFRTENFGAKRPPVDCETTDFANYISRALDGGVGFADTTAEETCAVMVAVADLVGDVAPASDSD